MCNQYRNILRLILISVLFLSGCTLKSKGKPILPQGDVTMTEIYRQHVQQTNAGQNTRPSFAVHIDEAAMYRTYSQDALQELDSLFPVLPNPTLIMYVHPHLAGTDLAPVPGYYTSFPLYERTHYALPGEVLTKFQ